MCLRTEQRKPQIATEDIICYKIIHKDMTSLFHREFKWKFGKVYHTEMTTPHISNFLDTVIEQGFHSYSTLKGTIGGYYNSTEPCIAVKCTIPKGSEYYTGNHGVRDGYASNKLIVNEIMPLKELYPNFDFDKYPYKEGDKVIIKFAESTKACEGVIENIQPYYGTNNVDILVSLAYNYWYIHTRFDGKECIKELYAVNPRTRHRVIIKEFKIKED